MSDQLSEKMQQHCETAPATYDDLKVLFLNCTLNRTPVYRTPKG
jgi:hypothetical protein